ncbi:MAG: sodium/proton-translocating pyrophosphatase, partial [Bacteroidia bacterium]|nr:sodium/proton-translocating pyrophosphatase [Bacteroidia bacterium]MDW8159619.1 sodium/proton-translocating pyrophosphatase [Bacteroidia bacterium]
MDLKLFSVPIVAILVLLFTYWRSSWIAKQDAGDPKMQKIAKSIAIGAMSFLKAEYRVLSVFVIIASILLGILAYGDPTSSPLIIGSFITGAVLSATAGFIGMRVATLANVRTTRAAQISLSKALDISFAGGSVMGLGVVALALLGLASLFALFLQLFNPDIQAGSLMHRVLNVLTGFSLGAESIALFA